MKKKIIIFVGVIILVFTFSLFYFQPLQLSNLINENEKILITHIELSVENGKTHNDSNTYNDLTDEQENGIIRLFENYSYRRTFNTVFTDGSLSDLGDELLHVFIYKDTTLVNSIMISTTGNISVNNKTYEMKNTNELIDKILEIIC